MENIQNVFMRLFQCKLTEYASLKQTSCTDVFWGRFCGFNKQGACLSQEVEKLSFEVKEYDISRENFQGTREKLKNTRPERMLNTNAGSRKTNAALCRGKHNAALFHNPNQDVRMAMQGDFQCLLDNDGFKHIDIQKTH